MFAIGAVARLLGSALEEPKANCSGAAKWSGSLASARQSVLVVGSINVDLYQDMPKSQVTFGGNPVALSPIRGMTLPAASAVKHLSGELEKAGLRCAEGAEEAFVLGIDGPFDQKTGGKGANAAAAAGQTFACEFIGNMGDASATENASLLADLTTYGSVNTQRCGLLKGLPTGTAYILLFPDNDNCIPILGGANQSWPTAKALENGTEGPDFKAAIADCVCVMLQREIPEYVNVVVAKAARAMGKPVFMDVGGTDAPLDKALMPYVSVIAPNESELTFISGLETKGADGKITQKLVREAVAVLKGLFKAVGNLDVEVMVTLGEFGSMHFQGDWCIKACCGMERCTRMGRFALQTKDGKAKDTTGAGDCFRGSYVAARYGLRKSVKHAMHWAAAAGSLAVEVKGAMPSMPSIEAIAKRASQGVSVPPF